jgi:predicted dehydrogenase/threonine dehydrogenase-like Zn-dependent dehydrogenase
MEHPDEVRRVLSMAASQGLKKTESLVRGRLEEGLAVGYSAAGLVIAVGAGVDDVAPGDRVACAGAGYASHAEVIRVPRNLVCRVPEELDDSVASTVAIGSIAMQGVRRAQPSLGETFVVIGLGAIGQITSQLLHAAGCRVIGSDLSAGRAELATRLGMDSVLPADGGNEAQRVLRLTRDVGADGVIITASSPSDSIVHAAFQICRKRGRVILVGDVGLSLQREDIYRKELDFLVSTSYGPGRYDEDYEERGGLYPVAYVRWTETRNMQEYLDLAAEDRIKIAPLIGLETPLSNAAEAYRTLQRSDDAPVLAVLQYESPRDPDPRRSIRAPNPSAKPGPSGAIRIAVVGPGGFVRAVHMPNLRSSKQYELRAIVSRSGARASAVARQFGAGYSTTAFEEALRDPSIDAVLIATRHNLHASMTLQALTAGKHVLVEKPLALTRTELDAIRGFYADASAPSKPMLLTGFNRRFSPLACRVREQLEGRTHAALMTYRMNAGFIPPDSWVHGEEGGGRNLGEACHIYDLFTYLIGSTVRTVDVQAIPPPSGHRSRTDNFVASFSFEDGSVASLTYTSLGHAALPKERLEVFVDGTAVVLDDYREVSVLGGTGKGTKTRLQEKGHAEELAAFARGVREGTWPIPLWEQLQATEMALRVQEQLVSGSS